MKSFRQILCETIGVKSITDFETIPFITVETAAKEYASQFIDEAAREVEEYGGNESLTKEAILNLKSQLQPSVF